MRNRMPTGDAWFANQIAGSTELAVAAGTITFGTNAGSGDFKYWLFFETTPGGDYGTDNAIIVQDKDGVPITGTYAGSPVAFSFAYDTSSAIHHSGPVASSGAPSTYLSALVCDCPP